MDLECVICFNLLSEGPDVDVEGPPSKRTRRSQSQQPQAPVEGLAVTKCGHVFHKHCILEWQKTSKTCPTCTVKSSPKQIGPVYLPTTSAEDKKCKLCQESGKKSESLKNENEKLKVELDNQKAKNQENSVVIMKELQKQIDELKKTKTDLRARDKLIDNLVKEKKEQKKDFENARKQAKQQAELKHLKKRYDQIRVQNQVLQKKVANLEKKLRQLEAEDDNFRFSSSRTVIISDSDDD